MKIRPQSGSRRCESERLNSKVFIERVMLWIQIPFQPKVTLY